MIQPAWLEEAAQRTRDNKPGENAYGYFLKTLRGILRGTRSRRWTSIGPRPRFKCPSHSAAVARSEGKNMVEQPALFDVSPRLPSRRRSPAGGGKFRHWVRRPTVDGVWGWEAPGLPEAVAWWHWTTFEALPGCPPGLRLPNQTPPRSAVAGRIGSLVKTVSNG